MSDSRRFDYVRYDDKSISQQEVFKAACVRLEQEIDARLEPGRCKSLALTKLEEVYMWIGKSLRDEQIAREGTQDEPL